MTRRAGGVLGGWWRLQPVARRLIEVRALRSLAQGALAVDFVLYLKALHWSPLRVGALLAGAELVGAALGLVVGILSDRLGRRRFLLAYQAALAVAAGVVLAWPAPWVLAAAALSVGFGLGANGAAGPFGPAEQAWLAQQVPAAERGRIFSLNSAVGFWGMGLGSLLGGAVGLWSHWLAGPTRFLPLFWVVLIIAAVNYAQIAGLPESRPAPVQRGLAIDGAAVRAGADAEEPALRRQENTALALLVGVNAVNALAIGIAGPILPYWFALRYGVGPQALGPVYGGMFLLTGLASLAAGEFAARQGLVRSVVTVRAVALLLFVSLPFLPSFGWAAVAYTLRSVLNRGSAGARQAFGVGLVRDTRRGLASSLNLISMRVPGAVGPVLAGWLMGLGVLGLPIFVAAGLQLVYVVLFATVFGRYEAPRRAGTAVAS